MKLYRREVSLWRNRDYLLLWSGQLISDAGSGVSQIALPLLILGMTGSPVQAGLVAALGSFTYILWILPAGALLDRWDRKRAMIVCDCGRTLSLASIPIALFLGQLTLVQIYLVTFIGGTLEVFFDIAELACLPQVVEREQLPEALGRTQATTGIVSLLSPSIGGTLFTLRSFLPFLVDAISFAISSVSLLLIRVQFQQERSPKTRDLRREIGEGLQWLWKQPLLRIMALLTAGSVFCGAGYPLIVIVMAQQQHASNTVIGLVFSIGGIGGILGALLVGQIQARFTFAQIIVGVLWVYALLWFLLAVFPSLFAIAVITATMFFINPSYNVVYISRRLAMTPDILQSRVNSVARLIGLGFAPLGFALTGLLLQYTGPIVTVLLLASAQVPLAIVATLSRTLRYKDVTED